MTSFEHFHAIEFPKLLDRIDDQRPLLSNGIPIEGCSWDRKAAYLLWRALREPAPPPAQAFDDDVEALL